MKTIFFAQALADQHPRVYAKMTDALTTHSIPWTTIPGCENVWLRDYAPIPTAIGHVQFKYATPERDKYPSLALPRNYMAGYRDGALPIHLDGGNVVQNETHVLITEMVFEQNREHSRSFLVSLLLAVFDKHLVLLPVEPGDTLGHADGIAAFAPDGTVLVNDYSVLGSAEMDGYQSRLRRILERAELKTALFPFAYNKCPKLTDDEFRRKYPMGDENNPAVGYYLNFCIAGHVVLLPGFGFAEDAAAVTACMKHFPGCEIVVIECHDLAMCGGLLHCISWEH